MNDKTVNILSQYDMEVTRTFKGRNTLICDTNKGTRVLKEYKGKTEKLQLLDELWQRLDSSIKTDRMVRNKDGGLFVKDTDGNMYILKEQIDGRECSYKNEEDIIKAFDAMAVLHNGFTFAGTDDGGLPVYFYADEMVKHTQECRHVKNYLKKLRSKSDFERALFDKYDYFFEKAVDVTEQAKREPRGEYEEYVRANGLYCHGDYQYHNVVLPKNASGKTGIINFEHFAHDSGVRDFYLLFRKVSEKSDWSEKLADSMLEAYQKKRSFSPCEWRSFILRLSYPEKFWKIINFYINSRKSWMPDRNLEKFEGLIRQEKHRENLIRRLT